MKVNVSKAIHRNEERLKIIFEYDLLIKEKVKQLAGSRWSATMKQYCSIFEDFINYHRKIAIESLGTKEIKEYIGHLVQDRKVSASYQNLAVNAIKFYYEKVLGGPRRYIDIDRPRAERKLPVVLNQEEVKRMIAGTLNIKHKCVIMLLYSSGLRRSELLRLQLNDFDAGAMRIHIRGAKGKKDRFVPLSKKMWETLKAYIELYEPKDYLFEGKDNQYSTNSVRCIVKSAAERAEIKKRVTPHMLRHSYATHLLEAGTDTRFIQAILGHESSRTTEIYTHITQRGIDKIINPLDNLDI